ncbi:MAG: hypothetical protein Q8O72_15440 [Bacteroidales bacterium]|nr:hypothetical protein [Bacteroidales bacterium]
MPVKKRKSRKIFLISGIVLAVILVLTLSANLIVSRIVERKVRNILETTPVKGYDISFNTLRVNLFSMSVILKDICLKPDTILMNEYKSFSATKKTLIQTEIPVLKIRYLDALSYLSGNVVTIDEILYQRATITIYTGGGKREKRKITAEEIEKGINMNNLVIPGIGGVDIGEIKLNNLNLLVINPVKGDTLVHNTDIDFTLEKIYLIKNESDSNSFRLDMSDIRFELTNEHFVVASGKYNLSFSKLSFSAKTHEILINDFLFKPTLDAKRLASQFKYRTDVYQAEVRDIAVQLGDVKNMLITGNYYLPQIRLDGLNLFIVRNISLPFDEARRPLLPNQLLKTLKTDIDIDSLEITNGNLLYEETNNDNTLPMKVSLDKLHLLISEITSIRDSMANNRPMKIHLTADLQNQLPLDVRFEFPLLSKSDTFSFAGTLGGGKMSIFNPVVKSAVDVKFVNGKLNGIDFSVQANPAYAMGEMTMLYTGLQGEVLKKSSDNSNKLLSWIADQVVKSDNPFAREKPRVVPVYFDRVMYKGFGNFAFKSLLSGILASTIPTFDHSNQKKINVRENMTKKYFRKQRRQERRDKK